MRLAWTNRRFGAIVYSKYSFENMHMNGRNYHFDNNALMLFNASFESMEQKGREAWQREPGASAVILQTKMVRAFSMYGPSSPKGRHNVIYFVMVLKLEPKHIYSKPTPTSTSSYVS